MKVDLHCQVDLTLESSGRHTSGCEFWEKEVVSKTSLTEERKVKLNVCDTIPYSGVLD